MISKLTKFVNSSARGCLGRHRDTRDEAVECIYLWAGRPKHNQTLRVWNWSTQSRYLIKVISLHTGWLFWRSYEQGNLGSLHPSVQSVTAVLHEEND